VTRKRAELQAPAPPLSAPVQDADMANEDADTDAMAMGGDS
jgi:hypothetical protein